MNIEGQKEVPEFEVDQLPDHSFEETQKQNYDKIMQIIALLESATTDEVKKVVEKFFDDVRFNADEAYVERFLNIALNNIISKDRNLLKDTLEAFSTQENKERLASEQRGKIRNKLDSNQEFGNNHEMGIKVIN